jgi:hypothetical protein
MFTELSNQDPLKPNDSNTLLQQFSSLRNIEANLSLQDKLGAVVSQGQLSTAGSLLGKYISGYTDNFVPAEGIVKSVSQSSDGPVLNLANGSSRHTVRQHSPPASASLTRDIQRASSWQPPTEPALSCSQSSDSRVHPFPAHEHQRSTTPPHPRLRRAADRCRLARGGFGERNRRRLVL